MIRAVHPIKKSHCCRSQQHKPSIFRETSHSTEAEESSLPGGPSPLMQCNLMDLPVYSPAEVIFEGGGLEADGMGTRAVQFMPVSESIPAPRLDQNPFSAVQRMKRKMVKKSDTSDSESDTSDSESDESSEPEDSSDEDYSEPEHGGKCPYPRHPFPEATRRDVATRSTSKDASGNFLCPSCRKVPLADKTGTEYHLEHPSKSGKHILHHTAMDCDHSPPAIRRWEDVGKDMTPDQWKTEYIDPARLKPLCFSCNRSKQKRKHPKKKTKRYQFNPGDLSPRSSKRFGGGPPSPPPPPAPPVPAY
jgi:hypothetical protein